jgi:hypothetical protein
MKYLGLSLIGSLVILEWRLFSSHLKLFGPLTSASMAERMPDLYPGGRIVLYTLPYHPEHWAFPMNLLMFFLQRLPHLYIMIAFIAFLLLLLLCRKFMQPRLGSLRIPLILWRTLMVSACLYVLAWWLLFYLYVPERYLEYTLLIIPSFMLGGLVYLLRQHYSAFSGQLAMGFMILALTVTTLFSRSDLMRIPEQERVLYAFLKTLPENGMIAAPPGLASNIPVYANRSVLLSNEAYIPFHQSYFREMKSRLKDWMLAYYATDSRPVLSLVSKYHIDYLIIQQKDFKKSKLVKMPQRYYHAFANPFFLALMHSHSSDYYLMQVPKLCIINSSNSYRMIDTKCLSKI